MSGPRILLVEDSEPVREAYSILLEDSGYRVATAQDGAEALTSAAATVPDLVLVDLGLPGMDGLQVIRELRAAPATARIPILALTGRDESQTRQACADAGASDYLLKPIPTQQLLRAIAEHLSAARD